MFRSSLPQVSNSGGMLLGISVSTIVMPRSIPFGSRRGYPRALLLTARDDGIVTNRNCSFYACFAALPLRINVTHYGLWQRLKHAPGQHRHRRPRPDQRRPRFPASSLSALANGTVRSSGALRNGGNVHQSTPNTGPSHVTNVCATLPRYGKGRRRIGHVKVAGISFAKKIVTFRNKVCSSPIIDFSWLENVMRNGWLVSGLLP